MKISFSKIFKSHSKTIPEAVIHTLTNLFPEAINIDWEIKKGNFEAIFYVNDVEHIAQITDSGILKEYKKNLWPAELPDPIREESHKLGEIMNGIAIYREDDLFYEVIVRDEQLNRSVVLFNRDAVLLSFRKL
jgi:hypothetical protein